MQAPFITFFMWLDEVEEGQLRDDLAMIIEEVLVQRILGVKNEKGVYITPAFPKLIYALDEDNITEDSKYWYLTVLAAKCTAKRMVPDYISIKKERELKKGDVYPCMGCVHGDEQILIRCNNEVTKTDFKSFWHYMRLEFDVKRQDENDLKNKNRYIELDGVEIYDTKVGDFVKCLGVIRNQSNKWVEVTLYDGKVVKVTYDHPFVVEGKGITWARDLKCGDKILTNADDYKNIPKSSSEYKNSGTKLSIVSEIKEIKVKDSIYSYDVTTESDHFEFSGLYSHNCRSFLTPDRSYTKGNLAKAKNFVEGKPKYYGRLTI